MKRILRDHYEDTFLEGPYFNPALPDFLTLCMHSSPACFTWGNTASSAIFVLPQSEDHLPMLWWNPVTPCTGLYVPFSCRAVNYPLSCQKSERRGELLFRHRKQNKISMGLGHTGGSSGICWIESKEMNAEVDSWDGEELLEKRSMSLKGSGARESQKQKPRR